jgi:hypothetical protein
MPKRKECTTKPTPCSDDEAFQATIQALIKRIEYLEFHDVKDSLPEDEKSVLIYDSKLRTNAKMGWYCKWDPEGENKEEGYFIATDSCVRVIATHWAPLPDLPT